MSRIKVYDTHIEIINGLFIDIPDGPDFDEVPFIIGTSPQGNYIAGFDPIDLPDTITVTRNPNEETSHQLRNMSEEEIINYFDTLS